MPGYEEAIAYERSGISIYDGPAIFLETYAAVPEEIGLLFAAHWAYFEICNGGFSQFFCNSTGVLAPEAARAFRALGQPIISEVIERAMNRLGHVYVRDREERQALLELDPSAEFPVDRRFDDLDDEFYRYIETERGGFEAVANDYYARVEAGGAPPQSG